MEKNGSVAVTQELAQEIAYLIAEARKISMSSEEISEQRMSFAYGNSAFENPMITKDMVANEAKKLVGHE